MDFKDIPPFTRSSTYSIDVEWSRLKTTIDRWVNEDYLELDPDFQRAHVWTDAQQIAYVEYALRGGRSGRELFFNCKGWNRGHREPGTFVLVDGKQRLNAVMRFLNNEIPAFGTLFKDFTGRMRMTQGSFKFNINDLETKTQVLQWYLEMNTGGTPHTDAEIQKVRTILTNLKELTPEPT